MIIIAAICIKPAILMPTLSEPCANFQNPIKVHSGCWNFSLISSLGWANRPLLLPEMMPALGTQNERRLVIPPHFGALKELEPFPTLWTNSRPESTDRVCTQISLRALTKKGL